MVDAVDTGVQHDSRVHGPCRQSVHMAREPEKCVQTFSGGLSALILNMFRITSV